MENKSTCLLCGKSEENDKTLNLNEAFLTAYLMKTLETPFVDMLAFKYGIIDEQGNQLKKPQTLEESLSYTSIDSYLIKLKKIIGNRTELLNYNTFLENSTNISKLPIELYEKELELKSELAILSNRYKKCLIEAKLNHLPTELIEKIVIESFI